MNQTSGDSILMLALLTGNFEVWKTSTDNIWVVSFARNYVAKQRTQSATK